MSVVVVALIACIGTGLYYAPGWNYLTRFLGYAAAIMFIFGLRQRNRSFSIEVWIYAAWLLWSLFAIFPSVKREVFIGAWFTNLQVCVLILIISNWVDSTSRLTRAAIAFLAGSMFAGVSTLVTGEYQQFAAGEYVRVNSFAGTNAFGFLMLLSTIAIAYLWGVPTSSEGRKRIVLGLGFVAAEAFCFASGSRKAIITTNIFFIPWLWFCYRGHLRRRPISSILVLSVLAVGCVLPVRFVQHTAAARRLNETMREIRGERRTDQAIGVRTLLIEEGIAVAINNPIIGVGLSNARYHFVETTMMTHCDLVEVAAATGIVGFAIYSSIFIVTWKRCQRIISSSQDESTRRIANLIRAGLVAVLLISLGRLNYNAKEFWVLYGSFIGWSQAALLRNDAIRNRRQALTAREAHHHEALARRLRMQHSSRSHRSRSL